VLNLLHQCINIGSYGTLFAVNMLLGLNFKPLTNVIYYSSCI